MDVAFRVDASTCIGFGHLKRCLSLAAALRSVGARSCFVLRHHDIDAAAVARAAGIDVIELTGVTGAPLASAAGDPPHAAWAGVDWAADADDTAAALLGKPVDWIVVDHYAFDARWHRRVGAGLGVRVAVIDDLADRPIAADLLIDHNFAADHRLKYGALCPASTVLLGGPRFALLGPEYADGPRHEPGPVVRSIGIFMGGADAGNFSAIALRACREIAGFTGPVEIATTSANPAREQLRALVAADPAITLTVDLPHLAEFFARHDLQIGAGGGATWERCCVGVPSLVLVVADNQRAVVPALAHLGALVTVDGAVPPNAAGIATALRPLLDEPARRAALSQAARCLVDGLGAHRVAEHLIHVCSP